MKQLIVKCSTSTDDNSKEYYKQDVNSFNPTEITAQEYKRLVKSSVDCETTTHHSELYTVRTHLLKFY